MPITQQTLLKLIPWHIRTSWGISQISEHPEGVRFHVKGNRYTGTVSVSGPSGSLSVSLPGHRQLKGIPSEELSGKLDRLIEHTKRK